MMKSEMGWVLQHLIDHGFCRNPIRRLGWEIGKVGFPIHFAGDKVECPTFHTQIEESIAPTADRLPDTR